MTGQNFCASAVESWNLMTRNAARFTVVEGIGHMFTFLGELFICCTTSFIAYLILTNSSYYQQNLHSPLTPTIVIAFLSFVIGSNFMSVYGIASDTILHCYCMDEEMNNSAVNAKRSLHDFMKIHVQERQGLLGGQLSSSV